MPSNQEHPTAEPSETRATIESTEQFEKNVEDLQAELDALRSRISAIGDKSTKRIALAFAVPGVLSLVLSVLANSVVLAFIGLGLTFWGAIFYLIRPVTYIRGNLFGLIAESFYSTVDRITEDLECKGKALYIPPPPKAWLLPVHLRGLRQTVTFISIKEDITMPSMEEIAKSKFITKNPKGICLIPPGSSLLEQIQKILQTDLTQTSLEDLCTILPQLIIENFQFAKEIEMKTENNQVFLKMTDSIYRNLYLKEDLKAVKLMGCPLASAIASAAAQSTGKPAYIQSVEISPDTYTIEIFYAFMEA